MRRCRGLRARHPSTCEDPMAPSPGRALCCAAVVVVLAAGAVGCGAAELDESQVVATLRSELESHGVQADDLSCPGDLPAVLGRSVVEQLGRAGVTLSDASCATDLPAQVGATVSCRVTGADGTTDWTVGTTSVTGGKVDYSIEQAGLA